MWTEVKIDFSDFSGDLFFDFNFTEVCENFLHPFFGEAVMRSAGHGDRILGDQYDYTEVRSAPTSLH